MMIQYINDNFIRATHTVTVKLTVPQQSIPIQKLNIRNTEWTCCGSVQKGEVSIALILDYCDPKHSGTWAGMHGELLSQSGHFMSHMTKLYFIRPGQNLFLNMRIFPENYKNVMSDRKNLPKGCFYVRISTTLAYGLSRTELESFLQRNNTILETIPWPTCTSEEMPEDPDCTIKFLDGPLLFVHKATMLAKLELESPMRRWSDSVPADTLFYARMNAPAYEKSVLLFHQLLCISYIPWKKIELPVLIELFQLASYFQFNMLLQLCEVQLIHTLRQQMIDVNETSHLIKLNLPCIIEILDCHQVTAMIRPEVGYLFVTQ